MYTLKPYFGAHGNEETPVPIPNTEVKLVSGDYTATSGKLARRRIIHKPSEQEGFCLIRHLLLPLLASINPAAKDIYPAKALPAQGLEPSRKIIGDENYRLDYTIDYKTKKIDGSPAVSEVNSLKIRSDSSFNVDFNCETGRVVDVVLHLPPAFGAARNNKRLDMIENAGGSLGEVIRNVVRDEADRIRFVFGDGYTAPAIVAEKNRVLGIGAMSKKISHPYDGYEDSFRASNPRDDRFSTGPEEDSLAGVRLSIRRQVISGEMFINAVDKLFKLIPQEDVKI